MNQRVYRYIGCGEEAPPITLDGKPVVAGQIVDDPALETDARFMAILNPEWVDPPEKAGKSSKKPDNKSGD